MRQSVAFVQSAERFRRFLSPPTQVLTGKGYDSEWIEVRALAAGNRDLHRDSWFSDWMILLMKPNSSSEIPSSPLTAINVPPINRSSGGHKLAA